jgi:hypothetical protein
VNAPRPGYGGDGSSVSTSGTSAPGRQVETLKPTPRGTNRGPRCSGSSQGRTSGRQAGLSFPKDLLGPFGEKAPQPPQAARGPGRRSGPCLPTGSGTAPRSSCSTLTFTMITVMTMTGKTLENVKKDRPVEAALVREYTGSTTTDGRERKVATGGSACLQVPGGQRDRPRPGCPGRVPGHPRLFHSRSIKSVRGNHCPSCSPNQATASSKRL